MRETTTYIFLNFVLKNKSLQPFKHLTNTAIKIACVILDTVKHITTIESVFRSVFLVFVCECVYVFVYVCVCDSDGPLTRPSEKFERIY